MKSRNKLVASLLVILVLTAACAPRVAHYATPSVSMTEEVLVAATVEVPAEVPSQATPMPVADAGYAGSALPDAPARYDRMVIKNAELALLVADTDIAIDRLTQIVGDTGGYIISSRMRFKEWLGVNYKYASITIGVPAEQFEAAMRRLRGIAVRVMDENASGQDVTDEYVDLQSRLGNLEATRDRIRTFLDQAQTVDEALRVNEQLAAVEAQIEQVKGRMVYLRERSAYSTITVQLDPELPPVPEATPVPPPTWSPADTARQASQTLTTIVRALAKGVIWVTIVLGPFAALVVGVWLVVRWRARGKEKTPSAA